jgi:hypothetical protein
MHRPHRRASYHLCPIVAAQPRSVARSEVPSMSIRFLRLLPLAVLGLAALASPALSQDLGGPLKVNGRDIPVSSIKREMVYAVGAQALEGKKLDVIIEEEVARRVAAGEDRAKFEFTQEEKDGLFAAALQQIRDQYPTLDPMEVLERNGLSKRLLEGQVAQTLRFDKVFLPADPRQWPVTTTDAITESAGADFMTKLREAQDEKDRVAKEAAAAGNGEPAPDKKGEDMFKMIMRKMVMQSLFDKSVVKYASNGLPEGVAMQVNERQIMTDEIYDLVSGGLNDERIRQTRVWLAKIEACKQELQRQQAWLGDEEFQQLFAEHKAPYDQSPFKLEVIATGFKRFPSMDSYMTFFRVLKSYERMIQPEINDENLTKHLARANKLLGLSRCNVQMILCSAMDMSTGKWRPDGWEYAKTRALEASKLLAEKNGDNWDAVLEEYSEFWDPPIPVGQPNLNNNLRNKGRIGTVNRNEMLQRIDESEFSMFVEGAGIVDYVFFDQPEGIDGPFKGPHGYYITRVISRTPPTKEFVLSEAPQRDLVVQDYLSMRINAWAQDLLENSKVEGLQ